MKAKVTTILTSVLTLVLILGLASTTVYAKDRDVIILLCPTPGEDTEVRLDSSFDTFGLFDGLTCAETLAVALEEKFKIVEAATVVLADVAVITQYTMMRK